MEVQERIDPNKLLRMAEVLKTIAHPIRLSVLECLQLEKSLSVSELLERIKVKNDDDELRNIEQSLLSHHLIKMKDKGILKSIREGKSIRYTLVDSHITSIFECMEKCEFL